MVRNLGLVSNPDVRFLAFLRGGVAHSPCTQGSRQQCPAHMRRPSNWTPDGKILLKYDVLRALASISDGSVGLVCYVQHSPDWKLDVRAKRPSVKHGLQALAMTAGRLFETWPTCVMRKKSLSADDLKSAEPAYGVRTHEVWFWLVALCMPRTQGTAANPVDSCGVDVVTCRAITRKVRFNVTFPGRRRIDQWTQPTLNFQLATRPFLHPPRPQRHS